jgi:murein L,D-transpeptidase YafK
MNLPVSRLILRIGFALALAVMVVGCQAGIDSVFPKAESPIPERLVKKMKAKGMTSTSPILLRIYKSENVIEVWKATNTGRYDLLESYEICKWSGKLGPKFKEGDRQAPEGFYRVGKAQLNPNSDYHLSFNIGYPNTFDRAHDRTGTHLMVHGACSSAGCYSMTDERVEEIYSLARDAIKGGQDYFQVQAYPFKMTAENLAKHATSEHFEFWKMLKEGSDYFELTKYPPKVDVCDMRYVFNREAVDGKEFSSRSSCPPVTMPKSLLMAYSSFVADEKIEFEKALKREKAKAERSGGDLANVNIDAITMIASGSEVLPPPTPVAPVVASTTPNTGEDTATKTEPAPSAPATASNGEAPPSITDNRTIAATSNQQTVTAIAIPTTSPLTQGTTTSAAEQSVPAQVENSDAAVTASQEIAIPVPQAADREAAPEAEAETKLPWWKRKPAKTSSSTGS